jgi:hypothetical protein
VKGKKGDFSPPEIWDMSCRIENLSFVEKGWAKDLFAICLVPKTAIFVSSAWLWFPAVRHISPGSGD